MSKVYRVFAEKKKGNDIEAVHMLNDLKNNVGITGLEEVRIINRYDAEGLSEESFKAAVKGVFSEANLDDVYYEEMTFSPEWRVFATEYLPGQYDQRADSAAQCIQLLTVGERPTVTSAKVIAVKGDITDAEFDKIKAYVINPVESRLASMDKPETLDIKSDVPADIVRINGFINMTDEEIAKYHASMGFAMSIADLCWVRDYFKNDENRDPSLTELKVIDTYWSDHCRHTTFATQLDEIKIDEGKYSKAIEEALEQYFELRKEVYGDRKDKIVCLMDMACLGTKVLKKRGIVTNLDESEEINACSINVDVEIDGKKEPWLVQFKNETHNHPTEIEPFGGAATCLGGAIRDPLSGRAYVYQAMRVTGAGDPTTPFEKTLDAKLPQAKITTGAAQGYSSYGNQIGLATGQVTELYDEGYVAKRMEIGAVIGASPKENVIREVPQNEDVIILLGGRTGRDGCGGATGSSKAHDSSSIETCGAEVQKGNPPTERKIQRLFRNSEVSKMIKRCNDFGAGGVCVAIGELADGLQIDLDAVPKKYEGLDGTELAISESQERMAVVVDKADAEKFIALSNEENLEATIVAKVTDNNRLEMTWRGDKIVDLSRDFLNTNGVVQHANVEITSIDNVSYRDEVPSELQNMSNAEALKANLSRLEVASQKGLVERFDASIGASTVLMPYAGKYQLTPEEAMVAKIPLLKGETDTATVMSYGFVPKISRWSPFHSAAFAVTESLAKLAAVGCNPKDARLTFQEYFEKLGNEPKRWGKPTAALLGALSAQIGYNTPSIGGKDSMSGSFNDLDVPPTLVSFAVGISKASETASAQFKQNGSTVKLVKLPVDEATGLPKYKEALDLMIAVADGIKNGTVLSASVVREGGSASAVCRMAFGNKTGFTFAQNLDSKDLFAPLQGSFVLELADENAFDGVVLGTTNDNSVFIIDGTVYTCDDLIEAWTGKLEKVFPTDSGKQAKMYEDVPLYKERSIFVAKNKVAKPRVFIPAFPGTNCEVDSARAFEKAGADVSVLVVNNLSSSAINETIDKMAEEIEQSQIIMLPGGFSGGDEPEGSGKFIATTFRNPKISEAVQRLLNCRDGLMLGICNGFQALIKLGLVPYGEIKTINEDDPTLTFNTIGRHVSSMAYTRVTSVKSPWLSSVNAGDMFAVPISHGEGRFVANEDVMKKLIENGQVATQYVNLDGEVVADMPFNPNGSVCAVEGITSPDGRVLGKMGHCERKGDNLYKNVPFEKDMLLFESGVKYFK
ncbi:phosphoribosylformylglycinamidine synthase [Eubacterium coprostanoligenes]|uniref:phosphoribosylformylglycinamidine synthase n=1 Tax=Eubacterium coprostanoligenes TaxID=290054 RepID=UPI002354CF5D|nr:phosphoribosylformylglycinamidine synthase [Eubacterium coprostanoligenes]MCI6253994.1 phosphoribosylformylglycinamidine synthase [Eubacterium coprostanoligenes]MDY5399883.1 phosphoribosylformylglycinamidine synthase [Eubacterium coprostanoligenes]